VASTDTDRFSVKLIAHDPEYKVSGFVSAPFGDKGQQRGGLHLRNGSIWIDVRPEPAHLIGSGVNGMASKPVAIGDATGELIELKPANFTSVSWTVDGQPVAGYSTVLGSAEAEVLAALGQIRFLENKLVFEQDDSSTFSAAKLEDDPNEYLVKLSGVENQTEFISYSVGMPPSYASDYLLNDEVIKRGSRTYYLPKPQERLSQISFALGATRVYVSGRVSRDRLLVFADTIAEATQAEWETILAQNIQNEPTKETPTNNVLVDGRLDEDDPSSAKFEFMVPVVKDPEKADCVKVVFHLKDQKKASCIARNSAEQFRLLETATADGVTVVYGVDAPDKRDSHVVRVTDAAGDVVAEDVTVDQQNFNGRAFGLALPSDSVAPFTVELFDFDREWFLSGDQQPDSFIRPGSTALATVSITP
jgi:hypothetical protein